MQSHVMQVNRLRASFTLRSAEYVTTDVKQFSVSMST
ncbi:hypothetical protein PF008_g28230 [Phytophthora fragariae]|uniref:Uncharacterized protein n=1 Tax=Phytophthora fragariae TaxID=53985 RepID=A0A6G0QCG8_9STRA|nr:hypothetical protein PF008_g28230 [Phytophthora fragariae]